MTRQMQVSDLIRQEAQTAYMLAETMSRLQQAQPLSTDPDGAKFRSLAALQMAYTQLFSAAQSYFTAHGMPTFQPEPVKIDLSGSPVRRS